MLLLPLDSFTFLGLLHFSDHQLSSDTEEHPPAGDEHPPDDDVQPSSYRNPSLFPLPLIVKVMTMEDDSIDQATSARRERLRALRAAKEYASMPDVDGDANQNQGSKAEYKADIHGEKVVPESFEEDSTKHAATSQRERLLSLKAAKEPLSTHDDGPENGNGKIKDVQEAEEDKASNMKFRNYLPHDKHLQEGKLEPVDLPKFEDPIASVQRASEKTEDPFVNIAPKKPNWDLRRDVQRKLEKLERRTQKALYEIMLEQEKEKAAMEVENED